MPDKKQRPILQRLGDLLATRIDARAWLQELLVEPAGDEKRRRSRIFGYTPAVLGPAMRTPGQTSARLLVFPEPAPKPPKAV